MKTQIRLISGMAGSSIHIGDMRVGGPKAWGGGEILKEWSADINDIVNALNNIINPTHRPRASLVEEIQTLLDSQTDPEECIHDSRIK